MNTIERDIFIWNYNTVPSTTITANETAVDTVRTLSVNIQHFNNKPLTYVGIYLTGDDKELFCQWADQTMSHGLYLVADSTTHRFTYDNGTILSPITLFETDGDTTLLPGTQIDFTINLKVPAHYDTAQTPIAYLALTYIEME